MSVEKDDNQLITKMYKQFLDLYSEEFQILILNRLMNVKDHFNKKSEWNNSFYEEYRENLYKFILGKIEKNNIVEEKYYLIAYLQKPVNNIITQINNIDEKINVFKNYGVNHERLDKSQILELLKESLFKKYNE